MRKILMISNFLESSGYSTAASCLAEAIDSVGGPIACRNIKLTDSKKEPSVIIKNLLEINADDCDILVIHSLPEFFEYDGRFKKCIGRFDWELPTFNGMNWLKKCKLMDELWVPSFFIARNLVNNGIDEKKIRVIPHPFNTNRLNKKDDKPGFVSDIKKSTGNFIFYTIGEYVSRKNYESLLKAWYSQFTIYDKAELIIKTSKSGWTTEQTFKEISALNEHVKQNIKVNPRYIKNPIFITQQISDEDIDKMHREADCFITTSHGEGFNLPLRDSLYFNKVVIAPDDSGHTDFANHRNSYLIQGIFSPCYGSLDTGAKFYNGYNIWYDIDINNFGFHMKYILNNPDNIKYLNSKISLKHDYVTVGNQVKRVLGMV